ncbi:MAG TPA: alpha-mannosidase 2c1, partial [Spirochaetia bacterium]|nr:alpha-mannosidase 2c1 [Spirochaetia bacterium]
SKMLEFQNKVDWHEKKKMLRVSFDTTIHSDDAYFDIQFGLCRRPNHRNTSWDIARFETVGHNFAGLTEADYGAALLNDCKYGYKVLGSKIDLNLLRSSLYPDHSADQGKHIFTYAYLPHANSLTESNIWEEALPLNQEPLVFFGSAEDRISIPAVIKGKGIILETLKKAEREDCFVLRAYETRGARSGASLDTSFMVFDTDMMEDSEKELRKDKKGLVQLEFKPFEIKTFKLKKA